MKERTYPIPSTIQEAEANLKQIVDDAPITAEEVVGIFRARVRVGDELLDAYREALRRIIAARAGVEVCDFYG